MLVKQLVEAIDFKNNFTPSKVTELALLLRNQKQSMLDTAFRMVFSQCVSVANSNDERKPSSMQLREHEMERRPIFFSKLTLRNMSL